jgi:hypothetical protein
MINISIDNDNVNEAIKLEQTLKNIKTCVFDFSRGGREASEERWFGSIGLYEMVFGSICDMLDHIINTTVTGLIFKFQ